MPYTIERRPVPTQGAREVVLPPGVYIDMTTWDSTAERSRLPIYPNLPYVDIMLNPTGQVVPTRQFASPAAFGLAASFYHFWIAEREDLHVPVLQTNVAYNLPMPAGTNGFPDPTNDTAWKALPLRGENRLLTLYARTGNIVVNKVRRRPTCPRSRRRRCTPQACQVTGRLASSGRTSISPMSGNKGWRIRRDQRGPPPIYSSGFLGTNVNQPYIEADVGARGTQ